MYLSRGGAASRFPLARRSMPRSSSTTPHAPMSDHSGGGGGGGGGQRQCRRRGGTADVELDAAMALANMAGAGPAAAAAPEPVPGAEHHHDGDEEEEEEEELASTRLSLELGKVGIQSASSACSSSSSAGHPPQQPPAVPAAAAMAAAPGYGARPGRHALTEAEKEAKRLRRVLANRESARQTILRRQAIRDELARKVADLSQQNESMKKEKETVMQEYLTLKEANKQLKEQVVAKTTRKASPAPAASTAMDTALQAQQEAIYMPSAAASSPQEAMPLQPSFLYTSAPAPAPAVPVPYAVWGNWPGYEHGHSGAGPAPPPPLCAWYYPVVAEPRSSTSTTSYAQPFQGATSGGGGGGGTAEEEDTDDDPCSLTLGLDVDRRTARAASTESGSRASSERPQGAAGGEREKAEAAAEARKRRKELTKLKQMQLGARPGDE